MEYLDICDERGLPTGRVVSRERAHAEGICHRTAHVWVVDRRGERARVLMQKRAQNKESFPGCYDTSSAGHIPAGDEPAQSALRELFEELGIRATAEELSYAGSFRIQYEKMFFGKLFRDNEVTAVYVYEKPVDAKSLVLQPEEVEAAVWFDLQEVVERRQSGDPAFCVPTGGLMVLTNYLRR